MNSRPISIASHQRVVVLTGAGIIAESGIRTFRDAGGLSEEPFEMRRIQAAAVLRCDLFVVIGTSGSVYPAAGLVNLIASRRADGAITRAIYVGPEPPLNASSFQEMRLGTACEIVPTLFHVRESEAE